MGEHGPILTKVQEQGGLGEIVVMEAPCSKH